MKSILRTLVAVVAAISVLSTASTALAKSKGGSGWLTQGAEILPKGTYAFEVRSGWPSTDFGVHIPVSPEFEITPFLTLDYLGYNIRNWNATFGNTFGVQLKGQVWKQGPHAISLGADLGIAMNYLGFSMQRFRLVDRKLSTAIAGTTLASLLSLDLGCRFAFGSVLQWVRSQYCGT